MYVWYIPAPASITTLPSSGLIICPSCFYCCLLYLNSFRGGRPNQKAHFLKWVGTDAFHSMSAVQQLWLMGPRSRQCCSNNVPSQFVPSSWGNSAECMYEVFGASAPLSTVLLIILFELPSHWRAASGMNRVGHSHCEVWNSAMNKTKKTMLWTSWFNFLAICLVQLKM